MAYPETLCTSYPSNFSTERWTFFSFVANEQLRVQGSPNSRQLQANSKTPYPQFTPLDPTREYE